MVPLYRHADGMAAVVPGRQCGDGGLALAFTTDIEKSPTRIELVICSGAMHPAGFPESDVCTGGRPIHVDVDILRCDTSGSELFVVEPLHPIQVCRTAGAGKLSADRGWV